MENFLSVDDPASIPANFAQMEPPHSVPADFAQIVPPASIPSIPANFAQMEPPHSVPPIPADFAQMVPIASVAPESRTNQRPAISTIQEEFAEMESTAPRPEQSSDFLEGTPVAPTKYNAAFIRRMLDHYGKEIHQWTDESRSFRYYSSHYEKLQDHLQIWEAIKQTKEKEAEEREDKYSRALRNYINPSSLRRQSP